MKKAAGSQIPSDLTREILLRLPARSVVRFRLTCKLWRSTTVDPNFVEAHLHLARKRNPPSILLAPSWGGGHDSDFAILDGDSWTPKQRFWSTPKLDNVSFHGSCNGIVCIAGGDNNNNGGDRIIQLLNPATGDSLTLPKSRKFFRAFFGFHPVTKEYKVIIIYDADPESTLMPGCQIYTIGADTSWRDIDVFQDFEPYQAAVLSGVIYMVSDADTASIVSFDLKDESFKQFPFLDFGQDYYSESVDIIELQGILCVSLKYVDERMEVWRLTTDDSGGIDNHRWALIYSILPWDGLAPTSALFIHQNNILTMSYLYSKHDADCYEEIYNMVCYRYVNKGTIGLNKILYMHRGYYYIHVHLESLVVLPNR